MSEKYVNAVNVGGVTKLDLTADTVTPETLIYGTSAHNAAGAPIIGVAGLITVDDELSATSENPAQNKVITAAIQNALAENEAIAQIADRTYQGTDLTAKFAGEIANYSDEWAWIRARITAGNFSGIHVCDYIPVTMSNGVKFNAQVAGINTYKGYGMMSVARVKSHIDFISKEVYPTYHVMNKVRYNNGISGTEYPWLASDLYHWLNSLSGDVPNGDTVNPETAAVDYTGGGVYFFLPEKLKTVITEKVLMLPKRYNASSLSSSNSSWGMTKIGKLWLPDECELTGTSVFGGADFGVGGTALQYPIFVGNINRKKDRTAGNNDGNWWLLSPISGNYKQWMFAANEGTVNRIYTDDAGVGVPVCFRVEEAQS